MLRALFATWLVATFVHTSAFAKKAESPPIPTNSPVREARATDGSITPNARFALAAANTTVLANYSFDIGATCTAQGWTVVDATAQIAEFWHVDDFASANVNPGDSLAVLAGSKSLWCGARAATNGLLCSYAALPGYGNNWDQVWQTKTCIPVVGLLDVSFLLELDTEASYDFVVLEYTTDCTPPFTNWIRRDGGLGDWDGRQGPFPAGGSYSVAGSPVNVRLRFESDGAYSDQDGFFDSHAGPVVIDNLLVEGLALEDFEGEALNATETEDWEADVVPGYGASYMALFPGSSLVQEDACAKNLSCMWAAINGSTFTYACGGFPQQKAVPRRNADGQYINAEIWSPPIPMTGSGSVVNLAFSVYRDMNVDGFVFYTWSVRSIGANGCPGPWRDRGFVHFGAQKDWFIQVTPVGDLLDLTAPMIQVRIGILDGCPLLGCWTGVGCRSHAPLFDNVKVYRVDIDGPVWNTRDIDMFQDTFPSDGSDTGIGRADAAMSITAQASPTIVPGDSVRITVADPITASAANPSGLADDIGLGGKQVYLWVHVIDSGVPSATKAGAALSDHPNYPIKDTQIAFGKAWTRIQCRLAGPNPNFPPGHRFIVDLNDTLFEAGDVIEFFFAATSTSGFTSYCSGPSLTFVQDDVELAAEVASEFTILPLNGGGSTDILYVDGVDGRGAQVYWDTAFEQLGIIPDRYDVRGPTSRVSNRPGSRVKNVANQIGANYRVLLWDTGDLAQGLGDGTSVLEKSNDYAVVNSFLAGLASPGGIYVCGDDHPQTLNAAAGASAVTFKNTYVTYSLTSGNHRPTYGLSPTGTGIVGGAFADDTWVVSGACPLINDFDVVMPTGSAVMQSSYGAPAANNGAEISKVTGNARAMIAGFSFVYIRDDDTDGVMDRAKHLSDILTFLGEAHDPPTDASPVLVTRLEQNYPNPFNPQTTIAFSLRERGRVRIDVFNVAGQLVNTLVDETRAAGAYTDVRWNGSDAAGTPVASGVYFYRLTAGSFEQTKKMVMLK